MDGALLMAHQNVINRRLLIQRIIKMQHRTARIAEQVLNAFLLKAFHKNLSAG